MNSIPTEKVYVVTGASTGIGRAICIELSSTNACFALVGRNMDGLKQTQNEIEQLGAKAEIFIADLRYDAEKVAKQIVQKYKEISAIFNVAGVWHGDNSVFYGPMIWETNTDEIENVLSVGIVAPIIFTKTLLPTMVKKQRGKVIQVSGTFENGAKGWLHYYVSKKAIEDFTIGLSEELRESQIQVNTICPSDTLTDAYKKYYPDVDKDYCNSPQDIAKLAKYLVSDAADNITGQCFVVRSKYAKD